MEMNFQLLEQEAEFFKAFANPIRLCILKGLTEKGECNCTVMQEKLNIPQSTISQNMNRLKMAGIVAGRREGNEIHYRIVSAKAKAMLEVLSEHSDKDILH